MDDGLSGLGKRSALALVAAVLNGLATIAIIVVASRTLTTTGVGELFVAISLFTIVQGVCSFGGDTGMQFFVPTMAPGAARRLIGVVSGWSAASGLVFGALVWALADPIGRLLADGEGTGDTAGLIRTTAVLLPFAGLYEVTVGALRARDELIVAIALDRLLRPVVQVAGMIVAGVVWGSSTAVTLAWILPNVGTVAIAAALLLRVRPPTPGRAYETVELGTFWRFTSPRLLARTAQTLTQRLDILILAAVFPLDEAGIYGTVSRCMIAGVFVSTALRQTVQPQLRRLVIRGEPSAVKGLFGLSTTWLVLVSWPVYLTMIVYAPLVLSVFGDGYERGATALVILSTSMLIATACGLVDTVLLMLGKSWLSTANILAALVLNVAFNLLLAPTFGMEGAAVAWMIAILTTNVVPLWQTSRRGLTPFGRPLATATCIGVACVALPLAVTRVVFDTAVAPFVVGLMIATIAFMGATWHLRRELKLDDLVRDVRRPRRAAA